MKGKWVPSSRVEGIRSFFESQVFLITTLRQCRNLKCLLSPQRNLPRAADAFTGGDVYVALFL